MFYVHERMNIYEKNTVISLTATLLAANISLRYRYLPMIYRHTILIPWLLQRSVKASVMLIHLLPLQPFPRSSLWKPVLLIF